MCGAAMLRRRGDSKSEQKPDVRLIFSPWDRRAPPFLSYMHMACLVSRRRCSVDRVWKEAILSFRPPIQSQIGGHGPTPFGLSARGLDSYRAAHGSQAGCER